MAICYLSLGSNLGNKRTNLKRAVTLIGKHPQIKLIAQSSLYETEPVGYREQPYFLNIVIKIETTLSPQRLWQVVQSIEKKMGRKPSLRWGPRLIDIDILLYNNLVLSYPNLEIPHPELEKRAFVLIPLYEIAPGIRLPSGSDLATLIKNLSEQGVRRIGSLS
jgi:2-amino-4-hydroxy-6-hydroxymethyldihydropteridine diphosphokinase